MRGSCVQQARILIEQIRLGRFREDLLYKINSVTVEVPPLRERSSDIPWLLSRYFSMTTQEGTTQDEGPTLRGIGSLAQDAASGHPWRGNVRELRNRVERAVALATGPWLMPADLFPEIRDVMIDNVDPILPLAAVRDAAERRQIERVLRETGGHILEAARHLGISRTTLWEKMRRYGVGTGDANE